MRLAIVVLSVLGFVVGRIDAHAALCYKRVKPINIVESSNFGSNLDIEDIQEDPLVPNEFGFTTTDDAFFASIKLDFPALPNASSIPFSQVARVRVSTIGEETWIESLTIHLYEDTGSSLEFRGTALVEEDDIVDSTKVYYGSWSTAGFDNINDLVLLVTVFKSEIDTPVMLESVDLFMLTDFSRCQNAL